MRHFRISLEHFRITKEHFRTGSGQFYIPQGSFWQHFGIPKLYLCVHVCCVSAGVCACAMVASWGTKQDYKMPHYEILFQVQRVIATTLISSNVIKSSAGKLGGPKRKRQERQKGTHGDCSVVDGFLSGKEGSSREDLGPSHQRGWPNGRTRGWYGKPYPQRALLEIMLAIYLRILYITSLYNISFIKLYMLSR